MNLIIPPHNKISLPVKSFSEIKEDALKMTEFVQQRFTHGGWESAYSIAHPQVSYSPRTFFVVNFKNELIRGLFKDEIIINPVIILEKEKVKNLEGCMSSRSKKTASVKRYNVVVVTYQVPSWFGRLKKKTETCFGTKAFVFQHEIDHFSGVYL